MPRERINLLDITPATTYVYRPQEGMVGGVLSVDLSPEQLPPGIQLEAFQSAARFRINGGTFTHYSLQEQAEKGFLGEYVTKTLPSLINPDIAQELATSYRITVDQRVEIVRIANRGNGWRVEDDSSMPRALKNRILPVVFMRHRRFSRYTEALDFTEETPEFRSTFPVLEYIEITDTLPFFDPASGLFKLP
jgi:hypothetical protein